MHTDSIGTLFYVAEILIRERKLGAQRLVQRTRIPGTANELAKVVQKRGLRALESFFGARVKYFSNAQQGFVLANEGFDAYRILATKDSFRRIS